MRYAVGIPTYNRDDMLDKTITAIMASTVPPEAIIVVNNNKRPLIRVHGRNVFVVPCDFRTTGPEQGHQTALKIAFRFGFDTMVRWDDDLVPEPDCIPRLVTGVVQRYAAACGGMYPRPDDAKRSTAKKTGDGHPRHLQFFSWGEDKHRIIRTTHLYSSFAYNVEKALLIGGFCPSYSRFGQRGESDFTLRLANDGGRLEVDTAARAVHYWADGGRRFGNAEMTAASAYDNDLFRTRMIEHKIDPEKW